MFKKLINKLIGKKSSKKEEFFDGTPSFIAPLPKKAKKKKAK